MKPHPIQQCTLHELRKSWETVSFSLKNKDSLYTDGYRAALEQCALDLEAILDPEIPHKPSDNQSFTAEII